MRAKAAFLIGGVVGYVLGTRAGREQFERIRAAASRLWEDPRVRNAVEDVEHRAADLMKDVGPELKDRITDAVRSAADTVRAKAEDTNGSARASD